MTRGRAHILPNDHPPTHIVFQQGLPLSCISAAGSQNVPAKNPEQGSNQTCTRGAGMKKSRRWGSRSAHSSNPCALASARDSKNSRSPPFPPAAILPLTSCQELASKSIAMQLLACCHPVTNLINIPVSCCRRKKTKKKHWGGG